MTPEMLPSKSGESPSVDEVIERCTAGFHAIVDMQEDLLKAVLNAGRSRSETPSSSGDTERALRGAIVEAVEILDQTRKAFKSKQLEQLRSRLLRILEV